MASKIVLTSCAIGTAIALFTTGCVEAVSEESGESGDAVAAARSPFAKSVVGDYVFLDTDPDTDDAPYFINVSFRDTGRFEALVVGREGCLASSEEHDECVHLEEGTWSAKASLEEITIRPLNGTPTTYHVSRSADGQTVFDAVGLASGPGAFGHAMVLYRLDGPFAPSAVFSGAYTMRNQGGAPGERLFTFDANGKYSVSTEGGVTPGSRIVLEEGSYSLEWNEWTIGSTGPIAAREDARRDYGFTVALRPAGGEGEARSYQATLTRTPFERKLTLLGYVTVGSGGGQQIDATDSWTSAR